MDAFGPRGSPPTGQKIHKNRREAGKGGMPRDTPVGQRTDTLRGLLIIITPLLQDLWDDLPRPSLGAPPPPKQPEGAKKKSSKRPFDGWSAALGSCVSGSDSAAGFNLDPPRPPGGVRGHSGLPGRTAGTKPPSSSP